MPSRSSAEKLDAFWLKVIQNPQGKGRGRCCGHSSPEKNILPVSDGGVFCCLRGGAPWLILPGVEFVSVLLLVLLWVQRRKAEALMLHIYAQFMLLWEEPS